MGSTDFARLDWDKKIEDLIAESENENQTKLFEKSTSLKSQIKTEDIPVSELEPSSKRQRVSSPELRNEKSEIKPINDPKCVPIEEEKNDSVETETNRNDPINQGDQSETDSSTDASEFANECVYLKVPPSSFTEHPNGYVTFFHGCDAKIRTGARLPRSSNSKESKQNNETVQNEPENHSNTSTTGSISVPIESEPIACQSKSSF